MHPSIQQSLAATFVVMLLLSGWLYSSLDSFREGVSKQAKDTLKTTLDTTYRTLMDWRDMHMSETLTWASHPDIKDLTQGLLLSYQRDKEKMNNLQNKIDEELSPAVEKGLFSSYSILTAEGVCISSSQTRWLGLSMIKSERTTKLLSRVFDLGYVGFTVPEKGQLWGDHMLAIAPIYDDRGGVIAALAFGLNEGLSYSSISSRGQIGETGETYLFNADGQMLSTSKFMAQLKSIAVLNSDVLSNAGESKGLNIQIRDPGGDMTQSFVPKVNAEELPLTYMARSAVGGGHGSNLEGYNDYRGVPVVGVWLWDEVMEIGMTSEMDVSEAFASYDQYKQDMMTLFVIFSCLIVLLLVFVAKHKRQVTGFRVTG